MPKTYEEVLRETKKEFITFKIVKKRDSVLMQFINIFLRIFTFGYMEDEFLRRFATTIGNTVYVPDCWFEPSYSDADKIILLRHERIHMRQRRDYEPLWYSLLYLFLPVPILFAYYRMKFEKEAYEETFFARLEYYPDSHYLNTQFYKRKVVRYFTSAQYFWMWPWKKSIEKWYDETVARVIDEGVVVTAEIV